jgi:hypothetical protein
VPARARRAHQRQHLLGLVEVDRVGIRLAALVRLARRVDGQRERVVAHRVLEHGAEDLAVLVDRAGADRRLGVQRGEVLADVRRRDRSER